MLPPAALVGYAPSRYLIISDWALSSLECTAPMECDYDKLTFEPELTDISAQVAILRVHDNRVSNANNSTPHCFPRYTRQFSYT